jgi:citrate lyase subunit beta/citryl-CoA lyase
MKLRPRRSVLYMPGANQRALEKARSLAADTLILDLEDAVAPEAKADARTRVQAAVAAGGYGDKEIIVRANGLETPWGGSDLDVIATMPVHGVLLPKIETAAAVAAARARLGRDDLPLWIMIETPLALLRLAAIVEAAAGVTALVMGTSDLVKELRARHTPGRQEVVGALAHCVLVARAFGLIALDGVHLDFRNEETFAAACGQARDLGFDGKTLIHPSQIDIANAVFGPAPADVAHAHRVIAAAADAERAGKGVAVLDGRLIESLHVAEAKRVLEFAAALGIDAGSE